jgi:hypothetical protein
MSDTYWCANCREVKPDPGFTFLAPECEECGNELEEITAHERVEVEYKEMDTSHWGDSDDPDPDFDDIEDDDADTDGDGDE